MIKTTLLLIAGTVLIALAVFEAIARLRNKPRLADWVSENLWGLPVKPETELRVLAVWMQILGSVILGAFLILYGLNVTGE